jgi:hypothetical protein
MKMKPYREYSDLEMKKGLKGYTTKTVCGYFLAISSPIIGIFPAASAWLQGRGKADFAAMYVLYLVMALLGGELVRTSTFYRKRSRELSHQDFEQRKNRYRAFRLVCMGIGLLGMFGGGLWLWQSWDDSFFWGLWFVPCIFWAPWLVYTNRILTAGFFQEYMRRERDSTG